MIKYCAFALVLAGSLSLAALAEAGWRHGGCPGGNCGVPVYSAPVPVPAPMPAPAPPPVTVAPQTAPAAVVAVPAAQPVPMYYTSGRRWFGWRISFQPGVSNCARARWSPQDLTWA